MSLTMPTAERVVTRTGDWGMATRARQFVAILLQVLVVGAFWGSWIGLSRFMDTLTPATFVEVGHVMMEGYGPIMSVLMPAAVLATPVTARSGPFRWSPATPTPATCRHRRSCLRGWSC